LARSRDDVLNFVRGEEVSGEQAFYDHEYAHTRHAPARSAIESTRRMWDDPWQPQNALVWQMLGDIRGKRILLLGNGHSTKELWLLSQDPAALVYSDLSPVAVANIRDRFDLTEHAGRIAFAAIDAHHIPLFSDAVDIVYGYAMVHHLPDLDRFLAEVMRVLAPGGRAVFMDDAYSPAWVMAKRTVLGPLMRHSHRTTGISPEDYRFSMSGGFREQALAEIIRRKGGRPWSARTTLLQYLWFRGAEKLLPVGPRKVALHPNVARILQRMDSACATVPLVRRQLIRLVWGLDKVAPSVS
jgi:SAM-dependent methyltransferase